MVNIETIQITSVFLNLIAEVDEFKGAWRAMGSLAPDRLSALRHVATIESVGSSTRIEGSGLSDRDVERLLANLDITSFDSRDEQEVAGYAEVMQTVSESWNLIPVSENHILQLHRNLLVHSQKDEWHRGMYKTSSNRVAAFDDAGREVAVVFDPVSPFDTPRLMGELIVWFNEARDANVLHPLLIIGVFVVVLLEIHPFQDGNGRLSRILTTLLLLQAGYGYVLYSSLERVVEHNKRGYYLALRQTQGTIRGESPDWQPWLQFFLESLHIQMRRLSVKVEREQLLVATLPHLSERILDHARDHGRVTISEMVTMTGANRNTLKLHFRQLVRQRRLAQHGAGRGSWYALP